MSVPLKLAPEAGGKDEVRGPCSEAIDRLFAAWDKPATPGGIIAVIKDGQVVHQKAYGEAVIEHGIRATPTTTYRLASVTKHFLCTVALMLQDEDKLKLDDKIAKHIPELKGWAKQVTIRQMLTMTSGVRDLGEAMTVSGSMTTTQVRAEQLMELSCRLETLNFPPARQVSYCNTNYRLVQVAIERKEKASLGEILQRRIFGPLGMTRSRLAEDQTELDMEFATGYWFDKEGKPHRGVYGMNYSGSGGIVSCLADMLRWHQAFRDGGPFRKGLLADLLQPGKLTNGRVLDYNLGLTTVPYRGFKTFGHGGSLPGFKIHFMRFPEIDLGTIILSNREDTVPYQLAKQIGGIVLGDRARPAPANPPGLERLVGTWVDKATGYSLDLKMKDGSLVGATLGGEEKLEATGDGRLSTTGGHFLIEFKIPAGADKPKKLEGLLDGGLPMSWEPAPMKKPGAAKLKEYPGRYQNAETGATHEVSVKGKDLGIRLAVGHANPEIWTPMQAVMADTFRYEVPHMQWTSKPTARFERNRSGKIVRLVLSSNRCRNFVFTRVK
jgi:CubicO group peptidase (beta-lactamase class C family)